MQPLFPASHLRATEHIFSPQTTPRTQRILMTSMTETTGRVWLYMPNGARLDADWNRFPNRLSEGHGFSRAVRTKRKMRASAPEGRFSALRMIFSAGSTDHWQLTLTTALQLRPQQADHVIRGDHPRELAFIVHHRQGDQVVLIKQFGNFLLIGAGMAGDQGL
jgi:hypothetical protein